MHLYLMRHGTAFSDVQDPSRPLNSEGKQEVEKVGKYLKFLKLSIETIIHSKKKRAEETASIIASCLDSPPSLEAVDYLYPNDPLDSIFWEIQEQKKDCMIVGHLPFLEKLVSLLCIKDEDYPLISFDPASIVSLKKEEERWQIDWLLHPSIL